MWQLAQYNLVAGSTVGKKGDIFPSFLLQNASPFQKLWPIHSMRFKLKRKALPNVNFANLSTNHPKSYSKKSALQHQEHMFKQR